MQRQKLLEDKKKLEIFRKLNVERKAIENNEIGKR